MIKENAYAKINLGLEVGPLRDDGFHEMNSIICPVNLCDTLTFEEIPNGIEFIDNTSIKVEENFAYKAALLFLKTYDVKKGVRIVLEKKIPSEAGLGGGSSDAAAVLRGLNRLFNLKISIEELASLAKNLGSDMPYCVHSSLSFCQGRGEIVTPLEIDYERFPLAIVKPPYGLKTKEVYAKCKEKKHLEKAKHFDSIKEALASKNLKLLYKSLFNEMESAAFMIKPDLKELVDKIKKLGYLPKMTGSGTALYVFSKNGDFTKLQENIKYHQIFITSLN